MKKIRELYVYYKKKGLRETVHRIKSRYFSINTFLLYKRNLKDNFSGIMPDSDYRCVEGNMQLLIEARKIRDDLPREFYIDETHGGKVFYIVYWQDEIVYIHWIFRNGEYSRFFNIQDKSTVEINYMMTIPKFRGKRIQAKAINSTCEDLKEKGVSTVICAVSDGNTNSIKGLLRTGLKEFKRVKSYFSFVSRTLIK